MWQLMHLLIHQHFLNYNLHLLFNFLIHPFQVNFTLKYFIIFQFLLIIILSILFIIFFTFPSSSTTIYFVYNYFYGPLFIINYNSINYFSNNKTLLLHGPSISSTETTFIGLFT